MRLTYRASPPAGDLGGEMRLLQLPQAINKILQFYKIFIIHLDHR